MVVLTTVLRYRVHCDLRWTLVAMVTKIWDSTSKNDIMANGLDRHRVQQNIAYLVVGTTVFKKA